MPIDGPNSRGLRILSLDGGDARCMSQLYMLQEFMYRLGRVTSQKIQRPCDYFDLIVAVDGAGPLALFLGPFGMTVEEAQEAFFNLYTAVYAESLPTKRAEKLEASIKDLVANPKYNISQTAKLIDQRDGCKVAICYASAVHIDVCKMFRNYDIGRQSENITIVDAMRVSWATPGLMPPVLVGSEGREEQLVSAINGFNNPTQEAIKEAYHAFGPDSRVSCILSLGSGNRGVISLEEDTLSPRLGSQMMADCESMAEDIRRRIGKLRIYHRFSVDHGLEGWGLYSSGFGVIKSHVDAYLLKEAIGNALDDCLRACNGAGNVTTSQIYRSRAKGQGSSHGLPPLSAFFVARDKPMKAIQQGLLDDTDSKQKVMVLTGMGGSGKTQLALKFAMDNESSFEHILFIDASSAESIEKGMIARVRAIGAEYARKTVEEAMEVLAQPDETVTRHWLVIFDNADNINLNLANFFPNCRHGSILITSRNVMLGQLSPQLHLKLDAMHPDEALEALVSTIFPSNRFSSAPTTGDQAKDVALPTDRDLEAIAAIVKQLGYLPIAIIQAGCYIKQQHCLHDYLERLKANRSKVLERPTRFHLDKLRYPHGVYAAFDVTLDVLSIRARQLLGILSFGHFSNFPRPLLSIAAETDFCFDSFDLMDRTPQFTDAIHLLKETLFLDGVWEEEELVAVLEELQQYSLVTLTPTNSIVTLRFHPLSHSWSRDRLSSSERAVYQAAFIRLLACGMTWDNEYLFEYLSLHVDAVSPIIDTLHANDRAALSMVMRHNKSVDPLIRLWKQINKEVEGTYGQMHIRTSRAVLHLGDAYELKGDHSEAERLQRDAIRIRVALLGRSHVDTAEAYAHLAHTLREDLQLEGAENLEKDVLRIRIQSLGVWHKDTASGMSDLASTLHKMSRYEDEEALLVGAVDVCARVLGRSNVRTIKLLQMLTDCHSIQGHQKEAGDLQEEVWKLRRALFGEQHLSTVSAMAWLAGIYFEQRRYNQAESMRRIEVETRRKVQGDHHEDTLDATDSLARVCFDQGKHREASKLWTACLTGRKEVSGEDAVMTLNVKSWIARCFLEDGLYKEAEAMWREELEGRQRNPESDRSAVTTAQCWISRALFGQRRLQEALALWLEELEKMKQLHDESHLDYLNALFWVARTRFEQGYYTDAEEKWRKVYAGRCEILGEDAADTLYALCWLGRSCYEKGNYDEAAKLLAQEIEGWKTILWDTHSNTLFATFCFAQKRFEEATELWEQELKGWLTIYGENHTCILVSKGWLCRAKIMAQTTGNYDVVEQMAKEVLDARIRLLGDQHEDTIDARDILNLIYSKQAEFYSSNGRPDDAVEALTKELEMRRLLRYQDYNIAQILYKIGQLHMSRERRDEAKKVAEEILTLRLDTYGNSDYWVTEARELLKSIDPTPVSLPPPIEIVQADVPAPDTPHEDVPAPTTSQEDISVPNTSQEDELAPDPGGDPSFSPTPEVSLTPLPISRPTSPFEIRAKFGGQPNAWSMF